MTNELKPTALGDVIGELLSLCATYCGQLAFLPPGTPTIPQDLPDLLIRTQANWAELLNAADGGERHAFRDFGEWVERCEYLRRQAAPTEAAT